MPSTSDPPQVLIGLKPVKDLSYVTVEPAGVRIGALTTLNDIAKAPCHPANLSAAGPGGCQRGLAADPQRRHLAGNLCQEPRCWYYRNPDNTFDCLRKGGRWCDALFAENRYHSIFGGMCVSAAPCQAGCPIHNDIPAYMAKLRDGQVEEAVADPIAHQPAGRRHGPGLLALLRRGMQPVRTTTSRCPSASVERYLGDYALEHVNTFYPAPAVESGKTRGSRRRWPGRADRRLFPQAAGPCRDGV